MSTAPSFQQTKQLRATLILAKQGNQFATGGNTLILTGLRMAATVQGVVRFANQLELNIYGMQQADMNALTVIRWGAANNGWDNNIVTLEANAGNGWQQVFSGNIMEASPQYHEAPDVSFKIQARFGYYAGITPGTPLSYPNGVNVASAAATIAQAMGFQLENNGVTATLPAGSYFPGSQWDQFTALMAASDTDFYTLGNAIAICPKNTPRQNQPAVVLTPQTGLVGYPRIEVAGIAFECLFDPAVQQGASIQISGSDVPAANGTWTPYTLMHDLSTVKPGGPWFSSVHCLGSLS